CAIGHTSGVLF
nr:immunoglobulin light chain junction region [Macaca mulatta]MPN80069.1 immunoglobulin light chain junction region [Macaca mulatta]MPN80108.1 immunoglobulin light chain junction region [Macaca mulatta]MPN80252.1 immunoglobulin light chain junction region [Macaca mulatta]MPN81057.1 immunoglobulin light chain junction region [Macaca mulatta]